MPAGDALRFAVLGKGALSDAVAGALAGHHTVDMISDQDLLCLDASHSAVAVITDEWDTSGYPRLRRACAEHGLPWLPVRAELGTAVIGPVERAGTPGCGHCWELRRQRARLSGSGLAELHQRHASVLAARPSAWLTGLACDTVAALAADELVLAGRDLSMARTRHAALFVDLERLDVTRHRFLPEPLCPDCGRLPDDSPELAEITLVSRPKPTPHTYRVRQVIKELDALLDTYVDTETGLIPSVRRGTRGGLAVAMAKVPTRFPNGVQSASGRTRSYRASELTAILEALERLGGTQAGGKRTVVRGSYAELAESALDPRTLGAHSAESYELPEFAFRVFDEQQVCNWVWGYSFARQAPILVPAEYAYYPLLHRVLPEDRPFFYEVSNGCALGSCMEEAILHGVLEVAERDAVLMTWYGRMPVPRINLDSAFDRTIPLQAAAITAETGYRVQVHDATLEHGIPAVWAMAISPDHEDPDLPAVTCAGGAHLDPERAVLNALSELGTLVADRITCFPREVHQAGKMVHDPTLVKSIFDHPAVYSVRAAFDRLDFLTTGTDVRTLTDMRARNRGVFGNTDLRDDLREVLDRYVGTGMDVIVVDQTTPEHRAGGFVCVKAIVPGTVPITFGHHNRRIDGLPRLQQIPHRLGHYSRPLRYDELNPHPHPFT